MIFWVAAHSKVVVIHRVKACIAVPGFIEVNYWDKSPLTLDNVYYLCRVIANTVISAVG
ncbi:hypothetical protein D3C75_1213790 [compost metagenome]